MDQETYKQIQEQKQAEKDKARKSMQMKRAFKTTFISLVVLGVVGGGIFALAKYDGGGSGSGTALLVDAVVADDHTKGNLESPVVLVEYSDFQCPACGAYYPLVHQITDEFGDKITFAYRHFPLAQIHPNAELAARASEAAEIQGKFWEMHDMLFEHQRDWSDSRDAETIFASYAEELGLDKAKFLEDIDSSDVKARVRRDMESGNSMRIPGTPTFFLDGVQIQNPRSYDEFRALINSEIEKNS